MIPWVHTTGPFLPCVCGGNEQRPLLRTVKKDKYENGKQTSRIKIQDGNTARKNVWHAVKPLRRSQTKAIGFTRCASLHVFHCSGRADGLVPMRFAILALRLLRKTTSERPKVLRTRPF